MNSKHLLLMPLFFITLVGCKSDTNPKIFTYEETLEYIAKNSKEVKSPNEGYISFTSDQSQLSQGALMQLGASDCTAASGHNKIDTSYINTFMNGSATPLSNHYLPLMYLNKNNFPQFIGDSKNNFTYQLMNTKELVISYIENNLSAARYYNSDLRLTRFTIDSNQTNNTFTSLQTFAY